MKIVYIAVGFIFLLLGMLGTVLPVLPTTPFLLAAAFFLARGSVRFHRWFTGTALYRKHLESFARDRSMALSAKIKILGFASGMLLVPFFMTEKLWLKVLLIAVACAKYYYFIFKIKTIRAPEPASVHRRLLALTRKTRVYIGFAVLFRWIGLLGSMAAVTGMALLLQAGLEQRLSSPWTFRLILIFSGAVVLRFLCIRFAAEYAHRAAEQAKRELRARIYAKLLKVGLTYREQIATASLLQVALEGVEQLQVYLGGYLPQLYYSLLAPITLFFLFCLLNLKVALVLLLCLPLIPLAIVAVQKAARKLIREHWGKYTDLGRDFLDSLQGLTTLKIYDADQARHEYMNASAEKFRQITMKVLRMQLGSVMLMDLIAYGGTAAGVIMALTEIQNGRMALWSGVCVILLAAEFFLPLRRLGSFFHSSMNGVAAGEKVFALLDGPEPEIRTGEIDDFEIRLTGCSFSYDQGRQALQKVSLHIPPGSFVSVVGESGSGKSTLAGILAGTRRGYTGSVRIGGRELCEISEESIGRNIVLVEHNAYIFKGSVAENLLMGRPEASETELTEALKKARLYDFVKAQGGLGMKLQEQGANLSGGQRQRLALARALLRDAKIYLLDEALSNVDAENEEGVLQAIESLAGEKTVILITHRMAVAGGAERIFVFKEGVLTGEGKHGLLYRQNAYYAGLCDSQRSLENLEDRKEVAACAEAGCL